MVQLSARSGRRFAVLSATLGVAIVLALLAFAGSREAVSADASSLATATRPNVVMVLADDLDTHSLTRMVNLGLMPKLKGRVIDNGTHFTNSFVTTAWCCPTRATLLTGLYSHNHNVLTNSRPLGGVHRFNDTSTLATWLQQGGYRTGLVGKYLNNYGSNVDSSTPVDDVGYIPPGWNDWQALHDDAGDGVRAFQMYNYSVNDNGRMDAYGSAAAASSTTCRQTHTRLRASTTIRTGRACATRWRVG